MQDSHHHMESQKGASHHSQSSSNDDCCSHGVTELAVASKALPQNHIIISPVFFTSFAIAYTNAMVLLQRTVTTDYQRYILSYHPPIPDIRIAIQSFQV